MVRVHNPESVEKWFFGQSFKFLAYLMINFSKADSWYFLDNAPKYYLVGCVIQKRLGTQSIITSSWTRPLLNNNSHNRLTWYPKGNPRKPSSETGFHVTSTDEVFTWNCWKRSNEKNGQQYDHFTVLLVFGGKSAIWGGRYDLAKRLKLMFFEILSNGTALKASA